MTPHPVDLEPLQKLLDEATRTMPWSVFEGDGEIWYIAPVGPLSILAEFAASDFEPDEDAKHAALIVAAVNALPALLAEVRAARQAQDAITAVAAEYDAPGLYDVKVYCRHVAEFLRRRIAALASPSVPPPPKAQEAGAGFTPAATPEGRLAQWAAGHDPYTPAQEAGEETAALKEGGEAEAPLGVTDALYATLPPQAREALWRWRYRVRPDETVPWAVMAGNPWHKIPELSAVDRAWADRVVERFASEQPTAGPPSAPAALPKEEVAPGDDSPFGDDERAAYDAQIETVQAHAIREEEENARFRAALRACLALFANIRGDWTDPRRECRAGKAIIDAALSGETNLLRTLLDNEEQLSKESQ